MPTAPIGYLSRIVNWNCSILDKLSLVKPVKKMESLKEEGKISIEKFLGRLSARGAGKFFQGKLPRLQVQSEHGGLKFQEEGEIIYEAYDFDGMDDEIEEESPEFPKQEELNNKAALPDPDLA